MKFTNVPNFLVIGASHCGTTTLCATLGSHPDIFMTSPKEISYFCCDRFYAKGEEWYQNFFKNVTHERAIGEGTVHHSQRHLNPKTVERIANDLPNARILYITRHPMEQMASNWRYCYALGEEHRTFAHSKGMTRDIS